MFCSVLALTDGILHVARGDRARVADRVGSVCAGRDQSDRDLLPVSVSRSAGPHGRDAPGHGIRARQMFPHPHPPPSTTRSEPAVS
jgi:hypothetical protein